jgi:hypothetical protein
MIKLAQLLNEVLVKNKRTGNVYDVEKFNPAAHEKPKPADIKKVAANTGTKKPTSADLEKSKKISTSLAKRDKAEYDNTTRMIALARAGKLGAAKTYNPAQSFNKKVSKMTDNNSHSAAAVELAMYMDDKEAVKKLQQIKKDHDKRGSLSSEDSKERSRLVDKLLKKAKKELSEKDYKLINSSF